MSYTALYGPLRPLDADETHVSGGVKITDPDALEAWATYFDAGNILDDAEIVERTDQSSYPRESYDYLLGFRTHKPREPATEHEKSTLGAYHNIERLGYEYGGQFTSFWAGLSNATDAFELYHPVRQHGLDEAGEDVVRESTTASDHGRRVPDEDADGIRVAHLRCGNGVATVDLLELAVIDVDEEADHTEVEIPEDCYPGFQEGDDE